jgi:hypothetical protein
VIISFQESGGTGASPCLGVAVPRHREGYACRV